MTPKQKHVYESIRALINRKGYSPTIREVAEHAGISEGNARSKIHALRRRRMITMEPHSRRSIRLVEATKKAATHMSPERADADELRLRVARLERLVRDLVACRPIAREEIASYA